MFFCYIMIFYCWLIVLFIIICYWFVLCSMFLYSFIYLWLIPCFTCVFIVFPHLIFDFVIIISLCYLLFFYFMFLLLWLCVCLLFYYMLLLLHVLYYVLPSWFSIDTILWIVCCFCMLFILLMFSPFLFFSLYFFLFSLIHALAPLRVLHEDGRKLMSKGMPARVTRLHLLGVAIETELRKPTSSKKKANKQKY